MNWSEDDEYKVFVLLSSTVPVYPTKDVTFVVIFTTKTNILTSLQLIEETSEVLFVIALYNIRSLVKIENCACIQMCSA